MGLSSLGALLAQDPRFPSCAVEQMTGALLQQQFDSADAPYLSTHRDAFLAGGLDIRSLFRSIVLSPEYQQHRALQMSWLPVQSS